MAWYKTGTISVTNGSATVTGSGTAWVANVRVGDGLAGPDDRLYEITAVASNTSLTISPTYDGSTSSGQAYLIWPTSSFGADIVSSLNSLISTYSTIATGPGAGKFANGTAALPAVAAAADVDTGAYWTGSNGYGIATGGAVRGLFSSAGMALTGLLSGTAVTQTAVDTTAGRLTKVGDFGIAGFSNLTSADDYDELGDVGRLIGHATSTNAPANFSFSNGISGFQSASSSARVAQLVIRTQNAGTTDNRLFFRGKDTTWADWAEAYHNQNLLGTVSQTSGSPTGAVIERGSNANGEYVRFADGTQICNAKVLIKAAADVTTGNKSETWTYPAAFVTAAGLGLSHCISSISPLARGITTIRTITSSSVLLLYHEADGIAEDVNSQAIAIGRWF